MQSLPQEPCVDDRGAPARALYESLGFRAHTRMVQLGRLS
jgi:hypothetical protein